MLDWPASVPGGPALTANRLSPTPSPPQAGRTRLRLLRPALAGAGKARLLALLIALPLAAWLGSVAAAPAARAQEPDARQVFTYFYYWYETETDDPRSVEDHAALTNHFPPDRPADWRSVFWFKHQLLDMQTAGVDVALAVFWGNELYPETGWSTAGLVPLAQALDELDESGEAHPRIGLFLDTYVLDGADLTDPDRLDWLADQIRAFFRRVPERHRATQDGRPIIWLYLSNFANAYDQDGFDKLSDKLAADLGARPFWVAERSWAHAVWTDGDGERHDEPDQPMPFDGFYRWGAASAGTRFVPQPLPIASVGPGYDDTSVAGRGEERGSRPREDGCFYARNWRKAQALGARWVSIESWDELYEGSEVAETEEWGRAYLDATRSYSAAFKADKAVTLPAGCPEVPDEEDTSPDDVGPEVAPPSVRAGVPQAGPCPGERKKRPHRRPAVRCP